MKLDKSAMLLYAVTDSTWLNGRKLVDSVIDDVFNDLVKIKGYSESDAYKAIYQGGLTIKSTQDLNIQEICDEEALNPDNYDAGTKYSFFLSFQVKKKDGSTKNYTNQTMLSYYKDKKKNQDFSINYNSEEECRDAIAQYEKDVLEKGDSIVENSENDALSGTRLARDD